jgi:hypothetical protein
VNTHFKLNRQSVLEFCAEYEAERRKQPAKKLPLLLDLLDDPQLGVLNVRFPGMECPPSGMDCFPEEGAGADETGSG